MRHSIKLRVALWYAFSILAVMMLVFALLLAAGDRLILDETTSNLTSVTDLAAGDVWITDGILSVDDDIVYYNDGAYVVIYRDDGTRISGLMPESFPEDTPFEADEMRQISDAEGSYYVYDRLLENQVTGKIWVRGIASARLKDMAPAVMKMVQGFLIVLPILFLTALAGGWMITRQAFAPLNHLVATAESIRTSGELNRRIGLDARGRTDEVQRVAVVFDEMLDQIEKNFETEKRFTNDASHELRTPIAVILAESEYALDNLENAGEVRESLLEIREQANSMSSLVAQLLTMARADRGIEQLKKKPADISLLAEESAGRLAAEAAKRRITLRTEAEEGCYMDCDPVFIGRMFDNLIDNSVKYGREGGSTHISVSRDSQGIRIRVKDNGIGMASEELPRIWERFYRGKNAAAAAGNGDEARSVGLGLPLVRWIVEAHGGEIHTESREGRGTEFRIFFPLAEQNEI